MAWRIGSAGRHRLAHGLIAVLIAAGSAAGVVTAGAAPAHAATPSNVCQGGSTKFAWGTITKPWAVDHATEYVNDTSGTLTHSWRTSSVEVVRASAQATAGATYSENFLIESLSAHVNLKLAVAGSKTTTKDQSFTLTLRPQTTDIVFHAMHVVRGVYSHYVCKFGGWRKNGSGVAHSWYIHAIGAVNCPGSRNYKRPAAGTAGRAAQKYC